MFIDVYHLERGVFLNLLVMSEKHRTIEDKKLINLYYDVTCPIDTESQTEACKTLFDGGYYAIAATAKTRDVGEAFILTQNLQNPWRKNPMISPTGHSERSTCLGDLLNYNDLYYLVTLLGFTPIRVY